MSPSVLELELAASRARRLVLRMLEAHPAGHVGGALSAIDLVEAIYRTAMRLTVPGLTAPDRDRFLLSAGHKALAQYAVLAETGLIPRVVLDSYGTTGSAVPGHPDMHKLAGVEANTGALGHGLAIACGMALGARLSGFGSRVFVVMGDGELPEGSNWEGAAIAAHHRLDHLAVFVDANGLQISGSTREVMGMESISAKFDAFGWATTEVDGNDMASIVRVLDELPLAPGRPSAVIARTVKGRGVPSIEGTVASHYWKPSAAELAAAIEYCEHNTRRLEALVAAS